MRLLGMLILGSLLTCKAFALPMREFYTNGYKEFSYDSAPDYGDGWEERDSGVGGATESVQDQLEALIPLSKKAIFKCQGKYVDISTGVNGSYLLVYEIKGCTKAAECNDAGVCWKVGK